MFWFTIQLIGIFLLGVAVGIFIVDNLTKKPNLEKESIEIEVDRYGETDMNEVYGLIGNQGRGTYLLSIEKQES